MSHLTYAELEKVREGLEADAQRARRMLRAMERASGGRPRRLVAGQLTAHLGDLETAIAGVDKELWLRANERPVCPVCGDVNVSRVDPDGYCHSCSTTLHPELHHRPYRTEELLARRGLGR